MKGMLTTAQMERREKVNGRAFNAIGFRLCRISSRDGVWCSFILFSLLFENFARFDWCKLNEPFDVCTRKEMLFFFDPPVFVSFVNEDDDRSSSSVYIANRRTVCFVTTNNGRLAKYRYLKQLSNYQIRADAHTHGHKTNHSKIDASCVAVMNGYTNIK